jgi:voltage-gated potassium channel
MPKETESITLFEIIVLVLSLLVLGALLWDTVTVLPAEVSRLVQVLDNVICGVFLIEFVVRFRRAPVKLQFLKVGWIDLVASVPNIDILRWGRLVRVLRVIRILRGVRSLQKLLAVLFRRRFNSGVASLVASAFLLVTFTSFTILLCEDDQQSNIKTAEDAVWWSITTFTTVGYGDKYPVTLEGRLIATVLMFAGVGLFGTLSGLTASYFLGGKETEEEERDQLLHEIRRLREKVEVLATHIQKPGDSTQPLDSPATASRTATHALESVRQPSQMPSHPPR